MITVGSLKYASEMQANFDGVISIENADGNLASLDFHNGEGRKRLTLQFNDIDYFDDRWEHLVVRDEHLEMAREFYRELKKENENKSDWQVLVHCHAGRCRSPAIALFLIADELGAGREHEAVELMFEVGQTPPIPNLLVIAAADRILKRDGRLIGAWAPHEGNPVVQRFRSAKGYYLEKNHTSEDNK